MSAQIISASCLFWDLATGIGLQARKNVSASSTPSFSAEARAEIDDGGGDNAGCKIELKASSVTSMFR
jgi:hypothetical protein